MFVLLLKILIALFGFSILVFFHELGHFLIAKLFRIKVEKFSIGMGPAIFGFKKGETFFQIGTIPFGGFCQFKGDELKDDLPEIIKTSQFESIYSALDEGERKFLFEYYRTSVPDTITVDEYKIIQEKLSKDEMELFLSKYSYDNINENYKLFDKNEIEELSETFLLNGLPLVYRLEPNLAPRLKRALFKVLTKNVKLHQLREPDTFFGSKPYKRLLVAFFGPFMNYILAIVCFTFLALGERKELSLSPKIMLIDDLKFEDFSYTQENSPAKEGGLKTGDTVLKVDDKPIENFVEISEHIFNKGEPVKFELKRGNEVITQYVKPKWNPDAMRYTIGILSYIEPVILSTKGAKLNEYLELKDGDIIIGIDNYKENITTDFLSEYFRYYFGKNKKSTLYIKRGDELITRSIVFNEVNREFNDNEFRLYFKYPYRVVKEESLVNAFKSSIDTSFKVVKYTALFLYSLVARPTRNISKHFGGPIMIGAMISEATMSGFQESIVNGIKEFLNFVAMISLALAIFNLLPIPALDGGHIVLSFIEIVTRKSISLRLLYIINMIFFMLLMALGFFVAFLDITKLLR